MNTRPLWPAVAGYSVGKARNRFAPGPTAITSFSNRIPPRSRIVNVTLVGNDGPVLTSVTAVAYPLVLSNDSAEVVSNPELTGTRASTNIPLWFFRKVA